MFEEIKFITDQILWGIMLLIKYISVNRKRYSHEHREINRQRKISFPLIQKQYLFFKMGVSLGNKSLIGGVILFIPITFTMD